MSIPKHAHGVSIGSDTEEQPGVLVQLSPSDLQNGDVFRTLSMPENCIVGLDTMAMTTSKTLPGFRNIPSGAHLLWVQQPGAVSRSGRWFVADGARGRVRTKQWDRYNELLAEPESEAAATSSNRAEIESVFPTLQPYAVNHRKSGGGASTLPNWARSPAQLWRTLTSAITDQFLSRVTGQQGVQEYLVDSMDCANDTTTTTATGFHFLFAQDLRDLHILDHHHHNNTLDDHSTTADDDTSSRIMALLNTTTTDQHNSILAELQFTFLTGTHLGSATCLEQWWDLVLRILLRSGAELAVKRPGFVAEVLVVLHAQLVYGEEYVSSSSGGGGGGGGGGGSVVSSSSLGNGRGSGARSVAAGVGGLGAEGKGGGGPVFEYKPRNRARLRQALGRYKARLEGLQEDAPGLEEVRRAFGELEAWLWRWGCDLRRESEGTRERKDARKIMTPAAADSDEEEDEQPVVVQLDEEGREVGLVSFKD